MAFLRTVPRCSAAKKLRKYLPLPVGFLEDVTKPLVQLVQVHERENTSTTADVKPAVRQIDPLDLNFNDPIAAFKSKTLKELIRAYVVYQLCSIGYVVENNMKVSSCKIVLMSCTMTLPCELCYVFIRYELSM